MVLKPSDYSLPEMGESFNPTSPVDFLTRFLGMAFAVSVVLFAVGVGRSTIVPAMNSLFSGLTGGIISSNNSSGGPWEDA
jgi:hypothetical protein